MVFGARGPCGQHVRPVAVRGLGRGSDRATVLLLSTAANPALAPRDKLETAVTGHVQVQKISVSKMPFCLPILTDSSNWLKSVKEDFVFNENEIYT